MPYGDWSGKPRRNYYDGNSGRSVFKYLGLLVLAVILFIIIVYTFTAGPPK